MAATDDGGLRRRLDAWLTLRQPVTYWSFWARLLKTSPLLLLPLIASVAVVGDAFRIAPIAPVPYVFVAATLGFAVRRLSRSYVFVSIGLWIGYTLVLVGLGVAQVLLATPSIVATSIGLLTFVAGIAGFASPSLHRGYERTELSERQWDRRNDR